MPFYTYDQNNSGGYMARDENLGDYVIIEAEDAEFADFRATRVGIYFDSDKDCSCCGSRWSSAKPWYEPEDPGTKEPVIYSKPAKEFSESWDEKAVCVIHYLDGRKEKFSTFRQGKY